MHSNRPSPIQLPEASLPKGRERIFKRSGQTFNAKVDEGKTRIELYDEIGSFGISVNSFREKLKGAGDIVLSINSPGGDVFAGIGIYNLLLAHEGHIRVEVIGVAASAASIVAMAGDEIAIADNAFLMIHNSWSLTMGNRHDHDEISALLAQIDGAMAKTYALKTGYTEREMSKLMDEETWFEGEEAKAAGFATEILKPAERRAQFDLSVYAKAPSSLFADISGKPVTAKEITNKRECERFLRDAGLPHSLAKALAAGYHAKSDQRDVDAEASELAAYIAAKTVSIPTFS